MTPALQAPAELLAAAAALGYVLRRASPAPRPAALSMDFTSTRLGMWSSSRPRPTPKAALAPVPASDEPGRYYSPAEDRILQDMGARGASWEEVAAKLGRSTPEALRARFIRREPAEARARRLGLQLKRPPGAQRRPCMCCRRDFESTGFHHRMCDPCRENA